MLAIRNTNKASLLNLVFNLDLVGLNTNFWEGTPDSNLIPDFSLNTS